MLLCTVRDCRLPLQRDERAYRCARGHSFDIARAGYVNLLQPQDRRSARPGDSPEAVAGRRALHELGATMPFLDAIRSLSGPAESILDVGCGEGFYLGHLAAGRPVAACGVDLSVPAIEAAARRYPHAQWVVANADRFLPYADQSFDVVLSITARHPAAEFQRVLRPGGRLLAAVPAPDDLIELRGNGRDRVDALLSALPQFRTVQRQRVTTRAMLDLATLIGVLHSIYRPLTQPAAAMEVTLSLDLLLCELLSK